MELLHYYCNMILDNCTDTHIFAKCILFKSNLCLDTSLRHNVALTLPGCIPKYYLSWQLVFSRSDKRGLEIKTSLCSSKHGLKKQQQLACVKVGRAEHLGGTM